MEKRQKKAKKYDVQTTASVMGVNIATLNTCQVADGRVNAKGEARQEHRQRLKYAGVANFRVYATVVAEKEVENGRG